MNLPAYDLKVTLAPKSGVLGGEVGMGKPQQAFSLIELLLAVTILSFSILTMIGLVPLLIQTHQESRELVQGKGLLEGVLTDLRGLPYQEKETLIYGIRFDPESLGVGKAVECSFDQAGVLLNAGNQKNLNRDSFYFVQFKVKEIEKSFNRIQVRGQMKVRWPDVNDKFKKNIHNEFSLPVAMSYEK